ncbi:methyl-accepting chemotaxis protein [Burkholderia ambifaria]|uniref:Methyl-accepting chemotaxis sensory transducer n=1 Tax=Burkholderia ambifaria MEX-5 TaxID=396597 RepID=B1T450_9BURK|nr:methyl-accepting chemotaxis protein [Burkholderia ambifaria]EDT41653.1 methyl-accepting chemotaxis sensory transducer [Burkholderia ambifaria MEX-5]
MKIRTLDGQLSTMITLFVAGLLAIAVCGALLSRASLYSSRKLALASQVQTAVSVVERWKGLAATGALSVSQAKADAIAELRVMRYGRDGSGYYGIYDSRAIRLLNPTNASLEGKSAADSVDPNGKHVALEVLRGDGPGGDHFTRYQWPHPGRTNPVDKLVYSSFVPEWDWHIYTGAYVDDIDHAFLDELVKVLCAVALIGTAFGLLMYSIVNRVRQSIGGDPATAVEVARAVAAGDLSISVPVKPGDRSSVLASLSEMRERLANIVHGIRQASSAISAASTEVAQGSHYLSQRTEQQAAALQETAANMDQLNTTVQLNTEATRQANRLAGEAVLTAREGGTRVELAVTTMAQIAESAGQVASIISVIESIAFQTNILALNAAVEAARAGDSGRGFAVVASEVRTLARRTATSAKEVKSLVARSVAQSSSGEATVNEAGLTIAGIVGAVDRMSGILDDITTATTQQSLGIGQINRAVRQMDDVTQQNAALVEQTAAAAQALAVQAQELERATAVFRTHQSA